MMPSICETGRAMHYRTNRDKFTSLQALALARDGAGFCMSCEAITADGLDDTGTAVCPVCGDPAVVTSSDAQLAGALLVSDERPTLVGMIERAEKPRGYILPASLCAVRTAAQEANDARLRAGMSHGRPTNARRAKENAA